MSEGEVDLLEKFGVTLIVPIRLDSQTVAFVWLGRKLSGDEYDASDHEYLAAVAEQTAAGFDRMRLRVLEREVKKAWEIQQGLLPQELPQLAGVLIQGSCATGPRRRRGLLRCASTWSAHAGILHRRCRRKGDACGDADGQSQASVRTRPPRREPGTVCDNINRLLARNIARRIHHLLLRAGRQRTRTLVCTTRDTTIQCCSARMGPSCGSIGRPALGIFPTAV